jgi:hypothetical protein
MSLKISLIKYLVEKMNRLNAAAYILTGLTFSGTIIYSMVNSQEVANKKRELEVANKEITRLKEELANNVGSCESLKAELAKTETAVNTIGIISMVTAGAAIIGPAVLNSIRMS